MNAALAVSVRRHSLGWLVLANAAGLLLAALLLWPDLNDRLAPFTYGRWVPVHLDGELYGWCALPLAGVLLSFFLSDDGRGLLAGRAALACWSTALAFGCGSWLLGESSGKVFLEWSGPARAVWSLALFLAWLPLAWHYWLRRRDLPEWSGWLLAALAGVPAVLYWAADPNVYPAVDPDTGGATGASLLGSTLGIIAVFGLLPWLLKLPVEASSASMVRRRRLYGLYLVFSVVLDGILKRGNVTHHDLGHMLGLGSLIAWVPLVWRYGRSFMWPVPARWWLAAAFVWWQVLVVTGFIMFLPDVADRLKFTNGLVAHAHLAMAGTLTSLLIGVLCTLGTGCPAGRRWSAWLWQAGGLLQIGALLWLGWREGAEPALLYTRGGAADWCYGLRFVAGGAMLASSVDWLWAAWKNEQGHA